MARRVRESVGVSRGLLTGIVLAGSLSVLDSTIVVPLLKTIGDEFGGGSEVAWLVSAYLLSSTLTIPVWGRWHDLRGERAPMWAALGLFTVGTALAWVAPGLAPLVGCRVIQGIGAGGLVPLGEAVIASRCLPEERARLQAQYNVFYGVAAAGGPVIGGALIHVSWRWAFLLILPFCGAAALAFRGQLCSGRSQPATTAARSPLDYWGSALVTVGLFALLLGVERLSWPLFGAGVILATLFIRRTRTHPHNLIPRSVITNRVVLGCTLSALVIGFAQYSYLTYLPDLAQELAPDMNSGLVAVPLTVLWLTMGSMSAVLALRIGTRVVVLVALLGATAAGVVLLLWVSVPSLFAAATLVGVAASLGVLPALLLAQLSAHPSDLGATTSLLVLMRNFGGALGVSAILAVNEDWGLTPSIWVLVVVAAAGVLPASLIPNRKQEGRLQRMRAAAAEAAPIIAGAGARGLG
ncbi:MFS transporter [Mycobacterium simiae]|uniref:MFS transporter n=1 Tax=Mycobacterium simiae TaxID=1784 RepID=UPI00165F2D0B|nr:MFS transporter [Mycobacterium simiae]